MDYEIHLPASKPFLKVTVGKKKSSTKLGVLLRGETVTVVEIHGDRAKISMPVKGWCSFKNRLKGYQYLFACHGRLTSDETKAINSSHQDYYKQKIAELEDDMQIIISREKTSGRTDSIKSKVEELSKQKMVFEELLEPT